MSRQQWKICAVGPAENDSNWEVHVYVRDVSTDGTVGEWSHVVCKRRFDDSLMPTRGHALKSLARCLG